jgi:hypothetical protein
LDPEPSGPIPVKNIEYEAVILSSFSWKNELDYFYIFFGLDLLDLILIGNKTEM